MQQINSYSPKNRISPVTDGIRGVVATGTDHSAAANAMLFTPAVAQGSVSIYNYSECHDIVVRITYAPHCGVTPAPSFSFVDCTSVGNISAPAGSITEVAIIVYDRPTAGVTTAAAAFAAGIAATLEPVEVVANFSNGCC